MFSCSSASSICLFSRSSVCFSVCLTMCQNVPQNTLNFLGESASRPSWNVVRFSESRSECLCLSFPRKDLAKVKCCHVLTSVNKFQPPPTDKEVVYHPIDACWVSTQLYTLVLRKRAHGRCTSLCAQTRGWADICNIAAFYHEKAPMLPKHPPVLLAAVKFRIASGDALFEFTGTVCISQSNEPKCV